MQVGVLVWRVNIDELSVSMADLSEDERKVIWSEITEWCEQIGAARARAMALFIRDGEMFLHVSETLEKDGHPFMDWAIDDVATAPRVIPLASTTVWPRYLAHFNAHVGAWA